MMKLTKFLQQKPNLRNYPFKRETHALTETGSSLILLFMSSVESPVPHFPRATLFVTAFCVGAIVMMYELAGARMLAPYFGSGMDTWTTLIGTILAFLSLGYFLGGRLADRVTEYHVIGSLLFASALLIAVINHTRDLILAWIIGWELELLWAVFLASVILFAVPSVLLGIIQPYVVKLSTRQLATLGRISGQISTLSTAGGIFGTFASGFYVLPLLGTTRTTYALSGALLLLSLLYLRPVLHRILSITLLLSLPFLGSTRTLSYVVADLDTPYSRVIVKDLPGNESTGPVRVLTFSPYGYQSSVYLGNPDRSPTPYFEFFDYATNFHRNPRHVLMVGGGAFFYPEDYAKRHPQTQVSVYEIDPELPVIAQEYFDFEPPANLQVYSQDGRAGLSKLNAPVDLIILDAFSSLSIPFHLTTREYLQELQRISTPRTVVVANLIGADTGKDADFLKAYVATFQAEYADVRVFQNSLEQPRNKRQNFTVLAQNSPLVEYATANRELAGHEITLDTRSAPPLTDDQAPVEYYNRDLYTQ